MENLKVDPHLWDHLISDKDTKAKWKMDLPWIPLWGKMTKKSIGRCNKISKVMSNCLVNFGPTVNITCHFGGKLDIRNDTGFMSNEKI